MPYAHFWHRTAELSKDGFEKAVADVRLIIAKLEEMGLSLAGPEGYGKPELTDYSIAFNGVRNCEHRFLDFGEPFPADDAEGFDRDAPAYRDEPYWSGESLNTRVCHGGSCAGPEPLGRFVVDRRFLKRHWTQLDNGGYRNKCVTLFKPYDVAVTAALIRLKERLPDEFRIGAHDFQNAFEDGKRLCRDLFGWPRHLQFEAKESQVI